MIVEHPRNLLIRKLMAHGFLLCFLVLILFPFVMVLSISFREGNFATGSLFPDSPTLEHWALALGIPWERADGTLVEPPFPVMLWLWNSIKVGTIASAGVLTVSTIAAYSFSRIQFRFKGALLDTMLIIQMFPGVLALVALYAVFDALGKVTPILGVDSHWSLILCYMGGVTMNIWIIKGYFDSIDPSLDKATQIDGATPWQTFRHVFLPLSVPILAVVFVLAFIGTVTDYPLASVLLRSTDKMTLAVGAQQYLVENKYLWGDFAAAAILSGLPITVMFLMAQRYLVSGLSAGGVKG